MSCTSVSNTFALVHVQLSSLLQHWSRQLAHTATYGSYSVTGVYAAHTSEPTCPGLLWTASIFQATDGRPHIKLNTYIQLYQPVLKL